MGRRKLNKTLAEKKAQRAVWQEARNERRRKRYADDPEWRAKEYVRNRNRYRDKHHVEMRAVGSAADVRELTVTRDVIVDGFGATRKLQTVDYEDMARLLGGMHRFVLHRWHRSGRFPRGSLVAIERGNQKEVYTKSQALALLDVMREHHKERLYLMKTNKETISKLFAVMKA